MAGTIEKITSFTRVQVEEDSRNDDDLLFQTGLEKVQPVADCEWKTLKIKPNVEGRVRYGLDLETHFTKAADDIVAFFLCVYVSPCLLLMLRMVLALKWVCRAFISVLTLVGSNI